MLNLVYLPLKIPFTLDAWLSKEFFWPWSSKVSCYRWPSQPICNLHRGAGRYIQTVPVTFLYWHLVQCLVDTFSRSHGAVKVTYQCWAQREDSKQGPLHRRGHISVTSNGNLMCNEHFEELSSFVFPHIWTIQRNSWCLVLLCLLKIVYFSLLS